VFIVERHSLKLRSSFWTLAIIIMLIFGFGLGLTMHIHFCPDDDKKTP
jgi:multisubunit Na+/H+ antiporter MnhB subunit